MKEIITIIINLIIILYLIKNYYYYANDANDTTNNAINNNYIQLSIFLLFNICLLTIYSYHNISYHSKNSIVTNINITTAILIIIYIVSKFYYVFI